MQFDFSYNEYEALKERCPFTDTELQIFDLRRKGYSLIHISSELYIHPRTLNRKIKSIKDKIRKEINNI